MRKYIAIIRVRAIPQKRTSHSAVNVKIRKMRKCKISSLNNQATGTEDTKSKFWNHDLDNDSIPTENLDQSIIKIEIIS